MKPTRLFFISLLLLLCCSLAKAQKMWISGQYLNNTITYYENGKLTDIGTVWNLTDGPDNSNWNNQYMVAYGTFQSHKGSTYFELEKVERKIFLPAGTFKKMSFNCPISNTTEGKITQGNGKIIEVSSFQKIDDNQYLTIQKGNWGTKICNGKRFSIYYINQIGTISSGEGKPHYMSPKAIEEAKKHGGQHIVTPVLEIPSSDNITMTGSNISWQDAEAALAHHNEARRAVGVPPLSWSVELSQYAQEWADWLANNNHCRMAHRSSMGRKDKNYGENIFMGSGREYTALDASKSWYSEIKNFRNAPISSGNNGPVTGHYTQMIWHSTTEVGFGLARCPNGSYIIVANYNPAGNYIGETAY